MSTFIKPERRVLNQKDLEIWTSSQCFNEVLSFIQDLQDLVVGLTNDAEVTVSESSTLLLELLDKIEVIISKHPVCHEKDVSRFGKIEFRDFYDNVSAESYSLILPLVQHLKDDPRIELLEYLKESWGNRTRIDYGSGHEYNFISFLLCLKKLNIVDKSDFPAIVLKIFTKYISAMRILQKEYWLEPAGSHGVWGLDDYHFLPFLFGALQLATHEHLRPKLIHNKELVDMFYKKYMYFECIHFINSVKTVPLQQETASLRWHSPMLDDILSSKSWKKIKEGMIKMYKVEVMSKLPIVQHFLFGSLIPCPEGISEADEGNNECDHLHDAMNTWGDCCGIRIPSAIGAYEMNRKHKGEIPFD